VLLHSVDEPSGLRHLGSVTPDGNPVMVLTAAPSQNP